MSATRSRIRIWPVTAMPACGSISAAAANSDGLLSDEYARQEQDDALEIIAWLAAQPWCSGAVGMMGISWGGFNALQVAARRPPALKAIVTICSTDDRYADDVHYMGGAMLTAGFGWASFFFGAMCHPPDPALVGDRWRAMWLERLENLPLFLELWTAAPAARRLLAARLGVRGLRRDPVSRSMRSAAGPTATPTPSRACSNGSDGAAQGPDRAVGACLSAFRAARPADRLPAGDAALVGSLAEGHRHRRDGRAHAARLDDGQREARDRITRRLPGRWVAEAVLAAAGVASRIACS